MIDRHTLIRAILSPRRVARSRGHGVHSPFAYRFIREVISQPCAYYAYPHIDSLSKEHGLNSRMLRMLFRVAVAMLPGRIEVRGGDTTAVNEVIKLAGTPKPDVPVKAIVGLSEGIKGVSEEWGRGEHGMLFVAPEMAIFVLSDYLPHQSFMV